MDKRRDLNIAPSSGQGFLSPASGVVKLGDRVFVVSAETLTLAEFSLANLNEPGNLHQLLPNDSFLPLDGSDGAAKPVFESLVHLSSEDFSPGGALLAVPSGTSRDKCTGVLLVLDESGKVATKTLIDFGSLYSSLAAKVPDLNIEGAVCGKEKVFLFQRGNNNGSRNAVIELYKDRFIDCLRYFASVESISLASITDCELDGIAGFRLGFTDAATLDDGRIVFTAAAEEQGSCKGFAIGLMSKELKILKLKKFDRGPQIEGIFAESQAPPLLWMVFDKVAPETPSSLYTMLLE
jgi:hypothetical protein